MNQQELAGLIGGVDSSAHVVPELGCHLLFIEQARPRSFKQETRIHRQHLAYGLVDIQQYTRGCLLRGRHRFAASLGPFDHHRTGGCQQLLQLSIHDSGAVRPMRKRQT